MTYFATPDARAQATGMYIEPYAGTWPDLADILTKIYQDRMSQLPFLPPGWLNNVMLEHGKDGNVLIPILPRNALGLRSSAAPAWLDTQEKEDAWSGPAKTAVSAVSSYAANQAAIGQAQLQQLYDDSAYWDSVYNIAVAAASPITFFSQGLAQAGQGAAQFGQNIATGAMYLGIAAVAGIVLFKVLGKKARH